MSKMKQVGSGQKPGLSPDLPDTDFYAFKYSVVIWSIDEMIFHAFVSKIFQ